MSTPTRSGLALVGCRIAIVEAPGRVRQDSTEVSPLARALTSAGSEVLRIPSVRDDHPIPAGTRRTAQRIAAGQADAVIFPAAETVAGWVTTVERLGLLETIRRRTLSSRLLLVGADAVAAAALAEAGLTAATACSPAADDLTRVVFDDFARASRTRDTEVGRLQVRSGGVLIDGAFVPLARGAVSLIEALFVADGRVLSRAEIGRVLPGGRRSARAVEVAVARLRESLGAVDLVQTVVKRGYRLAVVDE